MVRALYDKGVLFTSLTLNRYVLSTTHLHEFKSPDRISSQAPVMSLPLADQKLGSHSSANSTSHKFMLKGRQSGGIHRGHTWVFRAESYDTMLTWFEDIRDLTSKAERKEFIRSHARSISAGSHKAGSISSDGGIEEDEADQVPYSATASQVEVPVQEEKPSDRPHPGGRFPSALKVDRDSQLSVSPSSPSSSDDIVVAASELPGSINPSGASGPHVQAQDYETIRGNFAAPLHRDGQSSPEHQREHTPVQHRAELTKAPGLDYNDSSGQMRGILPGGSGAGPDNEPQHQQDDATSRPLPRNMGRHDSKYGDVSNLFSAFTPRVK